MATRVIIVRHGQSSYNAQKRIQGRSNESVLTEKGQADAQIVGETLKDLGISTIFCSPLQRAKVTADIIQSCFSSPPSLIPSDDLLEVDLPLWENWYKTDVKEKFPEDYQCWHKRPQDFKMILADGRELYPVLSLYQQAKTFWEKLLKEYDGKTVLIVAHNGINRCLIMSAIGVPPENYHRIQQSNCNINILNFSGNLGEPVQLESLNQTSHLGVTLPSFRKPNTALRLLLIRHGETQWNRESRFQGIRDIPLNENGKGQAQKAADFLKDVPIDLAISSPMLRPKETAEIILQYHPDITLDLQPDLMEICHGLWEGKLESEIEADFPGLLQQWKDAPETVQMPEGENLQQVWDRAIACWNERVKHYSALPDKTVGIVVAHDAINKVILCYLLGLNPAHFWNIKQGNGGVSVIDYPDGPDGAPVLQAINITTHLGSVLDKTAAGAL
ncbi:MAG: histidine phosphatase family protein [Snowella sp.]|nr:histidine phosphatase family protein [Snowella sp.]